ncbi:hypothetical protein F2P56_013106 [Juglans regia]|uniref:Uncharacterized protein n=1 Tax=Juglans regia TaxID=51240 RepID=A0A833XJU2_JUGRE|nr:hypothetical protein F2P56_013106 [Juglans regia]
MLPKGAVGFDKVAQKGSSGGGAHTSNILVNGGEEALMVTATMDSNQIVVEEVWDLIAGYGREEIMGLLLVVPCEEECLGSGVQLGTVSGDNVVPLVSLPLNNIVGSPSDWFLHKVNKIQHIVGLTHGGCEDQFKALLIAIKASHSLETKSSFKKSMKLKRISWAINYDAKGGSSSRGKTKGRAS